MITIQRISKTKDYTHGKLYIDDVYFCDTIEPSDKIEKPHCIPEGIYNYEVTYSPRFKCYLPLIKDVDGFEGIRIHHGNMAKDSQGCILVGMRTEKPDFIGNSKETLRQLLKLIEGEGQIKII